MTCQACSAPTLRSGGVCVFCRTPVEGEADPAGLLDYLAAHLPAARVRRGLFGRGPVRSFALTVGGRRFRARLRKDELKLEPPAEPVDWCEQLLDGLRAQAAADHELRRTLTRSGWDFARR